MRPSRRPISLFWFVIDAGLGDGNRVRGWERIFQPFFEFPIERVLVRLVLLFLLAGLRLFGCWVARHLKDLLWLAGEFLIARAPHPHIERALASMAEVRIL